MLLSRPHVLFLIFVTAWSQVPAQSLETYLSLARSHNPAIRENENLAVMAGLEAAKARAVYQLPEISTTGNYLFAPVVQGIGYDNSITNGGLYSAQLNINQPLFTGPQVDAQVATSEVNQQIYRQQIVLSGHELDRQVTEQYLLAWQNLERVAYTERLLEILTEQEKVVRVFAENGILSQSDVLFFAIEKENQRLAMQDFQIAYRQGLAALNLLCGQVDTAYTTLMQPEIRLLANPGERSRFLEIFQLDSLLAASNQTLSEMKYRPQVAVFANGGLNAVMLQQSYKRVGISAGINFSLMLYDGHQRDLNRQQTKLGQETRRVQSAFQQNQVQQQRLSLLQQIRLLNDKIEAARRQVARYDTLLQFYRERIARGELSVNDYMNSIRSFASAQADLTSLKTSQLLLMNAYNYWNW
jgi:outer membrane protein TolC